MICRAAAPGDTAALLCLVRALNAEEGDPTDLIDAGALLREVIDAPWTIAVVAERDGALVGDATGHLTFETGHAERGVYVADLFVEAAHRRRGVGRALLAAMARAGQRQGARHLWLTAKEGNTGAHALYRALGGQGERLLAFACTGEDFGALATGHAR